jgi:glycerol kinase|tara:strand:- start:1397 stop:2896 length:1500 start_codon:yes stop_codon:yes gene_type:complete
MGSGIFLGIDHGGTTTTTLVLDIDKGKLASHSVPMPKRMSKVGWVEHDGEDFLNTSLASADRALRKAGITWHDVEGIGFANQGETSMLWSSETGKTIGPAISWEDKRTQEICNVLEDKGVDKLVRERTGILLDPYFSASKFRWLLDNARSQGNEMATEKLCLGGTETYVINRLTGGAVHATDAGTASRTALQNLYDAKWDDDLLEAFGLRKSQLPEIRPTCGDFGLAKHASFNGASIPITADAVDCHAALFAQGCRDNTVAKATYGTGAFIEVNTGPTLTKPDGLLPVFIAWDLDGKIDYTLEGGVFSVGSAIDWAVRSGWLPSAEASGELAQSVPDNGGIMMVPAFAGLSAPHWKPLVRASVTGLGLDTEPGHIARALLDGIAFQCADIVCAIGDRTGGMLTQLRADGGPTKNHYLMQRQADLLNMPVSVSLEPDMTALGVAYLAAIGGGQMTIDDVAKIERRTQEFEPEMNADEREIQWGNWRKNVEFACKIKVEPQ